MKKVVKNNILLKIIFYSTIYGIGFTFFIEPAGILATGFSGLAQIFVEILPMHALVSYSTIYFVLNIPTFFLAKKIDKNFLLYTLLGVVTVSISTHIFSYISFTITNDMILNCVFGGILLGYAIGGLLKIGSSSGGTDVIALYLLKHYNISFKFLNMFLNGLVVVFSMFYFGLEIGLYTLLSLFVRNLAINYVFTNDNLLTLFIVTDKVTCVSEYINNTLKRGTTLTDGQGGFTHKDNNVIMSVVNQHEYYLIKEFCNELEENIFITVIDTKEVYGNYKIRKDLDK